MVKQTVLRGQPYIKEVTLDEDLTADLLALDANGKVVSRPAISSGDFDLVEDQIVNGVVDKAPSQNAVFDALALKQGLDAELTAIAGLTSAANKIPYFTGSETAGLLDFLDEDNMVSDSDTAVPSQQSVKAYVDGEISTITTTLEAYADALISDVAYNEATWNGVTAIAPSKNAVRDEFELRQPLDAELTAIAGLTSAANKIILFTGSGTASLLDFSTDDTLAGDSDTTIPSEQAIKAYVDNAVVAGDGHDIEYNDTPLTVRATLNFFNGITAADDTTDIDISFGGPLHANTELSGAFNLDFTMDEFRVENNTAFFSISPSFEEGVGIMYIGVATTPPTTPPTTGIFMWVEQINSNYELRIMDSGGNIKGLS